MMNYSINRIANVVVGSGLIVATMVASTAPLGVLAVLPLIGASLVLLGVHGESPISGLATKAATAARSKLSNGASHVRRHAAA
ncbi:hypothetical protein [Kaarinaea lacus]